MVGLRGVDICDELKRQLECKSDIELANKIGVTQGRVSQLRTKTGINARYLARFIKRAAETETASALRSAIRPIVEFFPIEKSQVRENGRDVPFDTKQPAGKTLAKHLRAATGLYSFYNSQGEVIYFGKTEQLSLYAEMINAYNRVLPHYLIYRVRHPWGRYKSTNQNELRKIKKEEVTLSDSASYFSAYSVAAQLIGGLEALIIRIAPNDIINVKIEGKDMKAFSLPEV